MTVNPDKIAAAQELANRAVEQSVLDHIHKDAKAIPALYRQITLYLNHYQIGGARSWSTCPFSKRFQRFFDTKGEEEKPELAEFLAVKAVRDVLSHRPGDLFAQHASRRNLDEWAEGQLRAMTTGCETSSEPLKEQGTGEPRKVKSEPRGSIPPASPRPENTGLRDREPLGTPLPSSSNHPKIESPKPITSLANNPMTTPASVKRVLSRSGYPRPKRPRMVDEGSMAKVDYRDAGTQTTDDAKETNNKESKELESRVAVLVDAAIARRTQEAFPPQMMAPRVAYAQDAPPPRMVTELPANEAMQSPNDHTSAYGRTIVPPRRPEFGYMAPDMWDRGYGRGMRREPYEFPASDYGSMMEFAFGRVGPRR